MTGIADLAHERWLRSPAAAMTYAVALEAIAMVLRQNYPDQASEIEAFGERLTIAIDLHVGTIGIHPEPQEQTAG